MKMVFCCLPSTGNCAFCAEHSRLRSAREELKNAGPHLGKSPEEVNPAVKTALHTLATRFRDGLCSGRACKCRRHQNGLQAEEEADFFQSLSPLVDVCIENLLVFDYDERKDVEEVFSTLLRTTHCGRCVEEEWLASDDRANALRTLVQSYADLECGFHIGCMLRACAKHGSLVSVFLEKGLLTNVVEIAASAPFDIASDAFATLTSFLTEHKAITAEWLMKNPQFFDVFHAELLSSQANYVTQRQGLRLLSTVLLDCSFSPVMRVYVTRPEFLKRHMQLLLSKSAALRLESFQTFKLFVANPAKPRMIFAYLARNKATLIKLMELLEVTPTSSDQEILGFTQDKRCVLRHLGNLPDELPSKIKTRRSESCTTTLSAAASDTGSPGVSRVSQSEITVAPTSEVA
mmetsp:Transcript_60325/g.161891  ORF Transcript_60325/g.161891 Transcript_60325/m.161891 type:complete len:404 (+) Transcript_60325:101-1312(+)